MDRTELFDPRRLRALWARPEEEEKSVAPTGDEVEGAPVDDAPERVLEAFGELERAVTRDLGPRAQLMTNVLARAATLVLDQLRAQQEKANGTPAAEAAPAEEPPPADAAPEAAAGAKEESEEDDGAPEQADFKKSGDARVHRMQRMQDIQIVSSHVGAAPLGKAAAAGVVLEEHADVGEKRSVGKDAVTRDDMLVVGKQAEYERRTRPGARDQAPLPKTGFGGLLGAYKQGNKRAKSVVLEAAVTTAWFEEHKRLGELRAGKDPADAAGPDEKALLEKKTDLGEVLDMLEDLYEALRMGRP